MFKTRTQRKEQAKLLRVVLALAITAMMIMSSMMPAYYTFAEEEGNGEAAATKTEEPKKEEPKKEETKKEEPKKEAPPVKTEAPAQTAEQNTETGGSDQDEEQNPDPEPEATEPTQSGIHDEHTEETKADDQDADEEMPAQNFNGSAGGVNVKATAGDGVFPKGTKMKVSSVDPSYVMSAANGVMGEDSEVVDAAAVDITFYSKGKEVQPKKGSVGVSLSTGTLDGEDHELVHVSGNSASTIGGATSKYGSFRANHFSIYGIIGVDYENPDVEKFARYTYVFKVKGREVDSQTVRNGETVTAPEKPADDWFTGWEIDGKATNFPLTANIPEDATEDKVIVVEAGYEEVYRATFYKYENSTDSVLQVMEDKKGTVISTAGVNFVYDDGSAIIGWREKGTDKAISQVTLDRNYELVPIISTEPLQVTFVTGEGTPIAPVFVNKGQTVKSPADPTRSGYKFTGWYTDEACKNAYNFNTKVNENLTLYAGWLGEMTPYTVVYWKQNANDDNYTFMEMETRKDNAGTAASYGNKTYTGFTLNAARSNTTVFIKGDGTTIKNVYYDRNIYSLTFKIFNNYKWETVGTESLKYEQDTSKYWNEITEKNPGYRWSVEKFGDTFYSYAPPMKPANGNMRNFTGITAYGMADTGTYTISYLEAGKINEKIHEDFTGTGKPIKFTNEDHIIIPGFTFSSEGKFINGKGSLYYTRNTYSLKFVTNGGPEVSTVKKIPYESSLTAYNPSSYTVGVTTKTDNGITYTFEGWYENEAFAGNAFDFNTKMPALEAVKQSGDKAALVLYAKWVAEEHIVSFDLDGGTYDGSYSIPYQAVASGNQATAPDSSLMEKAGVAFAYWTDETGNRFSFDTRITDDYKLKALWISDNSKPLKVIYNAGEGSGAPTDDTKYQEGSMVVIKGQPTPPAGKNFIGWKVGKSSTVIAGGSFQIRDEDAVNGDIILTAEYGDKASHGTSVTYNANGGTINGNCTYTDNNAIVNGNYTIISDVPVREDYDFLGWSTDANADKPMFKAGETVAAGSDASLRKAAGNTLMGVWKKQPDKVIVTIVGHTLTVTYDGKEHKVEGYDVKISDEQYTENDFTFSGKAVASGIKVGTYTMDLDPTMFENKNENFNVVFEVQNGYLEIKEEQVLPDHEDKHFENEGGYTSGNSEGNSPSYVKAEAENADVTNGNVVKTGDESPLVLCILLMIMALVMTAAVTIRIRESAKF